MGWDTISDKLGQFGESVGQGLKGIFGSRNERMVKRLVPLVQEINALEDWAKGLTAEQFHEQTKLFKEQVAKGEKTLEDLIPHAFALVREASVRTLGMRHFDVQLVGGVVLHEGKIAEMMTGEGKTLVATLPLYLNALSSKTSYLVTVNDYLAKRDANWMGPVYDYLGVSFGWIQSDMQAWERQPVYACDIVYGTNNEFGFDYLRDNMKTRVEDQVQRVLSFAIVDEVDSILIDEARTPLIISGPAQDSSDKYKRADEVARALQKDVHYEVKEKERSASLLEAGIEEAERLIGVGSFFVPPNEEWPHFLENAVRAHGLYTRDKEYVVDGDEVIIVDEFTGRKMNGRRWSDGLHQAVETKEGLKPKQENQTLATITFQNYFRMFKKLAGMTGTAITEAGEFHKIYGLDVIQVPTNLPLVREDNDDIVYRTEPEKWKAIVGELAAMHEKGQPVLVGTTSIEKSEHLSRLLSQRGIAHDVLNAKQHEREAHIVARAGEKSMVTVATNMAGRGTDIKLGGNFEYRLNKELEAAGLKLGDMDKLAEIDAIRKRVREQCDADEKEVQELGGLYVLGTERHEARRIDNQLRGRSGRQGNAGKSRFYLSLEDDLMRIFYRDWVKNAMARLGMTEDTPIESGMVTRAIARAQKKVEDRNFEIRKSLLEYDEVMNEQRKEIYGTRQEVLESIGLREKIEVMFARSIERNARHVFLLDAEGFKGWFHRTFGFDVDPAAADEATAKVGNHVPVVEAVMQRYDEREKEIGAELLRRVERWILLKAIDDKWRDHLYAIDALKAGIGLRGYAQVDPKNEYKREGFQLFEKLLSAVEDDVVSLILRIQVQAQPPQAGGQLPPGQQPGGQPGGQPPPTMISPTGPSTLPRNPALGAGAGQPAQPAAAQQAAPPPRPPPRRMAPTQVPASHAFDMARRQQAMAAAQQQQAAKAEGGGGAGGSGASGGSGAASTTKQGAKPDFKSVGRNEVCPCGSGKKFKNCHGA